MQILNAEKIAELKFQSRFEMRVAINLLLPHRASGFSGCFKVESVFIIAGISLLQQD